MCVCVCVVGEDGGKRKEKKGEGVGRSPASFVSRCGKIDGNGIDLGTDHDGRNSGI